MTVVTGRCVTPDGHPAAGAYVYAWLVATSTALRDGSRVDERADTTTDRDGRWALQLPPARSMVDQQASWSIREVGYDAYRVRVPDQGPVDAGAVTTLPGEPPTGGGAGSAVFVRRAELGAPGGVATLGEDGLLRDTQRPDTTVQWFTGSGPPSVVIGARRGDMYVDVDAGELHQLT